MDKQADSSGIPNWAWGLMGIVALFMLVILAFALSTQ